MKKLIAMLLLVCLCVACLCVSTFAAEQDFTAEDYDNAELKGLIFQDSDFIYSDLAENYEAWWWEDYVEELDEDKIASYINMRGFAMSVDGKYAYMGTLNGGTGVRGVVVLDLSTGRITDLYYHYDGDNGLQGSPFSYAKGLDADDRGYVYTGFAFSNNYNLLNLGIAQQKDDGTLEEVYFGAVYDNGGVPGDSAGTKVGVNGVEVAKVGDKYYCYVMTNYQHDALYCYDVTDPANPVLNKNFGMEGVIDFTDPDCSIEIDGKHVDEGNYMEVDADGTVWLCVALKEGGTGILKIDASGITNLGYTEYDSAYCVSHFGKFIFVGLKNGSAVDVLDDTTMEKVATVEVPDADRVTRIRLINDTLYVCGAGNDSMTYNYIYAAPLTADAQTALDAQVAALNAFDQEATEPEDTTADPGADTTEPEDITTEPADKDTVEDVTTAPEADDEAEDTTAPADTEKKNCGSVIGFGVLAIAMLGACTLMRKKD